MYKVQSLKVEGIRTIINDEPGRKWTKPTFRQSKSICLINWAKPQLEFTSLYVTILYAVRNPPAELNCLCWDSCSQFGFQNTFHKGIIRRPHALILRQYRTQAVRILNQYLQRKPCRVSESMKIDALLILYN
jgi:hypothetical protein